MHLPFSIHRCQRLSLMIVTMAALSSSAWGGIIVSFGTSPPNPMTAGGSGILDVFVRSDVGTQILDGFQVQVGLIPTGGSPVGGLIFSNLQLDAQLLIGGPGGGYVFFGNSLSQNTSSSIGSRQNSKVRIERLYRNISNIPMVAFFPMLLPPINKV